MRFELTDEQRGFEAALSDLLSRADVVGAARAWARGESEQGLRLWSRLADLGVTGLVTDEDLGGSGASAVELAVAFEQLGRYAAPGPWVESVAYLPALLASSRREAVTELADGSVGTVLVEGLVPYALDADVADHLFVVTQAGVRRADPGPMHRSLDPVRRLFELVPGASVPVPDGDAEQAFDLAALACAAQLLGLGEQMLDTTVAYLKQRRQFGREIGSYQALKHQAADVRIALDFVRPLVFGAALSVGTPDQARDVSAAKAAASEGAYLAARTALQLHGAIGYTEEYDLSLWLLRTRALVASWGTVAHHRGRVLDAVSAAVAGAGR